MPRDEGYVDLGKAGTSEQSVPWPINNTTTQSRLGDGL
jgi:hypothetical protein